MNNYIVRQGGKVERSTDLLEWAEWFERTPFIPFESGGRRVALSELENGKSVSTVFLSVDHGWDRGDGPYQPVLFETMVYNRHTGKFAYYQERYCTVEEARIGHAAAVRLASGEVDDKERSTDC